MVKRQRTTKDNAIRNALIIAAVLLFAVLSLKVLFSLSTPAGATVLNTSEPTLAVPGSTIISDRPLADIPTITLEPTIPSLEESPVPQDLTPSPFPSPVKGAVGTNLPDRFRIRDWPNDDKGCNADPKEYTVKIYGANISYGKPPYQFTFWQFNNTYRPFIKSVTSCGPSEQFVEFEEPVIVSKGEYIHVVLTFTREDGAEVTWIDDLFYSFPQYLDCP